MPTNPCDQALSSQSRGTGPTVLLLHGRAASGHYWDRLLAAVHGRRLVAPDLLGFGRSPAPPEASYDVACHLAALERFVEDEIVIDGHSTGGILAAALAASHPVSVRSLVLVAVPAYPDDSAAAPPAHVESLAAQLRAAGQVVTLEMVDGDHPARTPARGHRKGDRRRVNQGLQFGMVRGAVRSGELRAW